jgi:hypothetical protein
VVFNVKRSKTPSVDFIAGRGQGTNVNGFERTYRKNKSSTISPVRRLEEPGFERFMARLPRNHVYTSTLTPVSKS